MFTTTATGLLIPAHVQDEINAEQREIAQLKARLAELLGTTPAKRTSTGTVQKAAAGTGIGKRCYELISAGMSNAAIVARVRSEFPTAKTTTNCINWYRNKANKSIN